MIPERGRILGLGRNGPYRPARTAPTPHPDGAGSTSGAGRADIRLVALALTLPMFLQVFHYVEDVLPLYYLSKVWPFVALPLVVWGLLRLSPPYAVLFMATLAWLIGVAPFLAVVYHDASYLGGFYPTFKIWPLTYYFAVLALVTLLRIAPAALERTVVAFGALTFAALWLLWVAVPNSWYASDPEISYLFRWEFERGYRIVMPMIFGAIFLFWSLRRFCRTGSPLCLVGLLVGLAGMIFVFKQRTVIAAVAVIFLVILVSESRGLMRAFLIAAIGVLFAGLGIIALDRIVETAVEGFGASLMIRQESLRAATDFMLEDPLRWIFGTGALTRWSDTSLHPLFGNRHFFLADLGWVGVVFEYGAVGVLLLLLIYLAGVRMALSRLGADTPVFEAALADTVLFLLLITVVYSPVFSPGEIASVMALLVYLGRAGADGLPASR